MVPHFIDGSKGKLFAIVFPGKGSPRANIVFLAPFAEEMNRCRNLVSTQAKYLQEKGYTVLVFDPYGTGDSQGELIDADWSSWSGDAVLATEWLQDQGNSNLPTILWGLRLGGLLAMDLAVKHSSVFRNLLLWQPILNGKTYVTQMLRQRLAHLVERGLPSESTTEMRERLYAGGHVEVGGYILGGDMISAIDALTIPEPLSPSGCRVHWLQQGSDSSADIPLATQRQLTTLTELNNTVDFRFFDAPPVWQLHERVNMSALFELTNSLELA